jgi:hypothetical protein
LKTEVRRRFPRCSFLGCSKANEKLPSGPLTVKSPIMTFTAQIIYGIAYPIAVAEANVSFCENYC